MKQSSASTEKLDMSDFRFLSKRVLQEFQRRWFLSSSYDVFNKNCKYCKINIHNQSCSGAISKSCAESQEKDFSGIIFFLQRWYRMKSMTSFWCLYSKTLNRIFIFIFHTLFLSFHC